MPNQQGSDYLRWYFDSLTWTKTTFLGITCLKSVSDMWNYQEILASLHPKLIVEFGVHQGGSSLFLATIAGLVEPASELLCFDLDLSGVSAALRSNSKIQFIEKSSSDPSTAEIIRQARQRLEGPLFALLDSDHSKAHVLAELELLRPLTRPGDYVIVEDGVVNGHPLLPDFGDGPWEAIEEYFGRYPDDYRHDTDREEKFGFTFAPRGFLIRQ